MHTCAAKCYSDRKSPIESVERCANICNAKLQDASVFVQREVEGFQVTDLNLLISQHLHENQIALKW